MNRESKIIPVFYAVDDNYIAILGASIKSLIENSSKENQYEIKILYTSVSERNIERIKKLEQENISIEFVNVSEQLKEINSKLYTRNYFSKTTYFRLYIPELYPQYEKAVYIDSDTIILTDIANLYNEEIGDNLLGAIPDGAVQTVPIFQEYVEKVVGVIDYNNYFNAGILLMNLKGLREYKLQEKFLYLLEKIKFEVAQD